MNPPEEFELSLPLLCLPLVIGVDAPGGDMDRLALACVVWEWGCDRGPPGELVPGDLASGAAYRCEVGLEEKGRGDVVAGFVCEAIEPCDCVDEAEASPGDLVVNVRVPDDVTVAFVVETCAAAMSEPGDTASYAELDLA